MKTTLKYLKTFYNIYRSKGFIKALKHELKSTFVYSLLYRLERLDNLLEDNFTQNAMDLSAPAISVNEWWKESAEMISREGDSKKRYLEAILSC